MREEQAALRLDPSAVVTGEVLQRMVYTRAVVREILRFRPPAPMVPQVCHHQSPATTTCQAGQKAVQNSQLHCCKRLQKANCSASLLMHVMLHCVVFPCHRSNVSLVAQIAQRDFQITESYTAPKGTLIMPSITAATMQVFFLTHCSPLPVLPVEHPLIAAPVNKCNLIIVTSVPLDPDHCDIRAARS